MLKFANIGKAVLIQALGLQSNHVVETEVLYYNNNVCKECEHYHFIQAGFEADTCCQNCPLRQTKIIKTYVNEKNKYGYRPMLKANALKLLVSIHFYSPDKFGIVKNVSIKALSELLNCDEKTIYNNLDILSSYGYISYTHTRGHVNILLCDYKKYFLPAREGGRGFLVMNEELLYRLMDISTITTLRIFIREIVEIDNLSAKGTFNCIEKTFKEIRRTLPLYCKKGVIKKALSDIGSIFNIEFKENSVRFHIWDECAAKKCKKDALEKYFLDIQSFFTEFNESVDMYNTRTHSGVDTTNWELFSSCDDNEYGARKVFYKENQLYDMAALSLQYSFEQVIDAFYSIYKTYISKYKGERNLGGLLRTVIEKKIISMQDQQVAIA